MKRFILSFIAGTLCAGASFAQGYYVEYKMTGGNNKMSGTMKTYAQDGNSRSEVSFEVAGGKADNPMLNHSAVSLYLKDQPGKIFMLNDKDKTYSEIETNKRDDLKDFDQSEYEVTVVGKETVNGYNSTHAIVKNKRTNFQEEIWTTTEIPGYSDYMKMKSKYTDKDNMFKAMSAKGAVGFPVRMKMVDHGGAMQVDLVKAEKRTNPASMFSLNGYTKSASAGPGAMGGAGSSAEYQQMMQKIQSMTPEERQKYMQQLKEKYQQEPKKN